MHPLLTKTAGWMSDLVSGLQNRLERFDSATGLQKSHSSKGDFFELKEKYIKKLMIDFSTSYHESLFSNVHSQINLQ